MRRNIARSAAVFGLSVAASTPAFAAADVFKCVTDDGRQTQYLALDADAKGALIGDTIDQVKTVANYRADDFNAAQVNFTQHYKYTFLRATRTLTKKEAMGGLTEFKCEQVTS
ncbi:MAG: hypothetical protein GC166_02445 [Alphaproteobacteria bacterium]|nr:hypothetical protein [Alphaproteobacteria bacterium]